MLIVCSIGPRVNNEESILKLYNAGMNMVRFNFSHIRYDKTEELIKFCRTKLPELKLMQDLQGPKIRVSKKFLGEKEVIKEQKVIFCDEVAYDKFDGVKNAFIIPVKYDGDFEDLKCSRAILMKDATMKFEIVKKEECYFETITVLGGIIRAEKSINFCGMNRKKTKLTEKDKKDILWGLPKNFDYICLSFVNSKEDVLEFKKFLKENLKKQNIKKVPKIWAKIETKEGVDNFDSILKNVDGIMLGRGDLTAEVGRYNVAKIQKELLNKMKKKSKDFIVATYVLESMRYNAFPYITELYDIYDCILNKVNGFMLCGEVGVGRHPIITVETLKEAIEHDQNLINEMKKIKSKK